ncbi:MAG: hypothetical protein L0H84_24095, partial [Pseudonocardia sp.]|nr:hypothetical protein [Pseudonocardia sp.]
MTVIPFRLQAVDQLEARLDLGVPQPGHHLVEQQQPRPQRQCLRELQPARVGDGQLPRLHARLAGDPHPLEHPVRDPLGVGHPPHVAGAVEHTDGDVLPHRHAAERPDDLEGPRDPGMRDRPGLRAGEVLALDEDPARGRLDVAGDQVDEGALAGAVGPDDAED